MAKQIGWSKASIIDRVEIFEYWVKKTKSDRFSEKLDDLFVQAASLISEFPEIGRKSEIPNLRVKVVKQYKMFYLNNPNNIQILRVWDARKNPEEFKI